MLEKLLHGLEHSWEDTAMVLPFLFVTYVVLELIAYHAGSRTATWVAWVGSGYGGPVIGGLLGVVPQCGFSAAAASLYSGRVIGLGTLLAVFLSTSDEMLPLFVAERAPAEAIAWLLSLKAGIGIVTGLGITLVARRLGERRGTEGARLTEGASAEAAHALSAESNAGGTGNSVVAQEAPATNLCVQAGNPDASASAGCACCGGNRGVLLEAAIHTIRVFVYLFLLTVLLDLLVESVGEDAIRQGMTGVPVLGQVLCALVGLIPNCAASVAVSQLYLDGVIGVGPLISGLLSSAGVGLLVLAKENRPLKRNLQIVGLLFAMSVIWGIVVQEIGGSLL